VSKPGMHMFDRPAFPSKDAMLIYIPEGTREEITKAVKEHHDDRDGISTLALMSAIVMSGFAGRDAVTSVSLAEAILLEVENRRLLRQKSDHPAEDVGSTSDEVAE